MGRPKPWLECGGEHLLQRVVRIVSGVVNPVVVAGQARQDLPALPNGVRLAFDAVEDAGPLAGMASGFDALAGRCDVAFVVACDQPLLRPQFMTRLIELLEDYQAVVAMHAGRLHPLTALYRLETRDILADLLQSRTLRVRAFVERCSTRIVHQEDFADCDPQLESLRNVNNQQDYDALMNKLGGDQP